MKSITKRSYWPLILQALFYLYFIVCYIVNLVQFFNCDFASPYKEEIIHGVGVLTYFAAGVTVWF